MLPVSWILLLAALQQLGAALPQFDAAGVVASINNRLVPLAPGLLISIYGSHLGPPQACRGFVDPQHGKTFPKNLCGVQVVVGGVPAGLLYVQEHQINFQVPQEPPVSGSIALVALNQGASSAPVQVPFGSKLISLSLEAPAVVGSPVWLQVSSPIPFWTANVQYPFDIRPANFRCFEIEVQRQGKLLPRFASLETQVLGGGIAGSGNPCGFLGLRAARLHEGRIPIHLQYRFPEPGTYEIRFAFHETWNPASAMRSESEWTPVEIGAATLGERAKWLAATIAPTDPVALLEDYLPSLLGFPDEQSLRLLAPYLYDSDALVRQFAMYGLTYWPAQEAQVTVLDLVRTRGANDVTTHFLKR